MCRKRDRVSRALSRFSVESWTKKLASHKYRLVGALMQKTIYLPSTVIHWNPKSTDASARRGRGRPPRRWDEDLTHFAADHFPGRHWFDVAAVAAEWNAKENAFLTACHPEPPWPDALSNDSGMPFSFCSVTSALRTELGLDRACLDYILYYIVLYYIIT